MSRIRYNIARRSRLPILLAVACVTAASCAVYVPSQECVSDADCSEGFRCGNESSCVALTAEAPVVCVAADGCVSPRVSVMLGQVEATRFSVMLNVDEPGSLPIVSMEACTSLNDAPSPDDATTQCLPAVDGANWQRQVTFDGREPDAVHFVFARVSTAAESVSSAVVQANTPPLAPANVRASDGSLVEAVEVVWDEVEGAREYLVWRDNSLVAVVDRAAYTDRDALPGGAPLAPVVDATDGTESFYVDVRWTPPASVPGATHRYSVQTAGQTGTSAMSQADDGFRAGEPATRYDLKIDDGEWFEVSGENYYHFEAPRRRFVTVPMTTTRGTIYGQIRASMPELPLYDPVLTGYSVRASNSAGSGPAGIDAGYLGLGPGGYVTISQRHYWYDWLYLGRPDAIEPVTTFVPEATIIPPELARTYTIRITARILPAELYGSPFGLGYAAECDMEHPCAVGLDCVSGVCTWPGFVPFFACETGRGMRTSEVDFGYQPGDRRGLAEVTYDFDMMPTEVTQADWEALFGENPAFFDECGADCPVENVTWWSAVAYANALSESWGEAPCYVLPDSCTGDAALGTLTCTEAVQLNNTSARYWDCGGARLPTEYEWEVAATGMGFDLPWGTLGPSERLDCVAPDVVFDPVANYCANSELGADACSSYGLPADCLGTQPVAQRLETGWGVYDILGNVAEWTWGERGGYERSNLETPTQNPVYVPRLGPMVVRGGSFGSSPRELHVARRDTRAADYRGADVGLRLVRTRP